MPVYFSTNQFRQPVGDDAYVKHIGRVLQKGSDHVEQSLHEPGVRFNKFQPEATGEDGVVELLCLLLGGGVLRVEAQEAPVARRLLGGTRLPESTTCAIKRVVVILKLRDFLLPQPVLTPLKVPFLVKYLLEQLLRIFCAPLRQPPHENDCG